MKLFITLLILSLCTLGCKKKENDSAIREAKSVNADDINEGDSLPKDNEDSISADSPHGRAIERIRQYARNHDKHLLAQMFEYPIERSAPFSNINDSADFVAKFHELFDDSLLSILDTGSWSSVGWRGLMIDNGSLWISGDSLISAINYETARAKKKRITFEAQKISVLHPSLRTCISAGNPVFFSKYRAQIDNMNSEDSPYRLVLWTKDQAADELPVMVLTGTVESQGSIGDAVYSFSNDSLSAVWYEFSVGEQDTFNSDYLEISQNGEVILRDSIIVSVQ